MKTTWLQYAEYDEYDNQTVISFEVPTDWLKEQIEEPLDEFLEEYTTDDSKQIYDLAVLYGKILNMKTENGDLIL